MNKTIIFDLGGVLVDWDPRYLYRSYFETNDAMDYFLRVVCTSDWNEEQDGGRTIAEATEVLVAQHPQYCREIEAFYGQWETMLRGPIEGTVEILKQIKSQGLKVYALTNWSAETFPIALQRFDFLTWFDGIVVSGHEKMKKPDPRIYQLLLSRYGLEGKECIFVDDNLRNIEAARKEDIQSIHFKNPDQLKVDLQELGFTL